MFFLSLCLLWYLLDLQFTIPKENSFLLTPSLVFCHFSGLVLVEKLCREQSQHKVGCGIMEWLLTLGRQ